MGTNGRPKSVIPSISTYSSAASASSSTAALRVPMAVAANKLDLPTSKHAVNLDEIRSKILSLNNCAFVECSAKTGQNINELFAKLFMLAKLPKQMSPGQHRHVGLEKSVDSALPPQSSSGSTAEYSTSCGDGSAASAANRKAKASIIRLRSKHSEPAVAFDAEARRPSLRTDLMLLRAKQSTNAFSSSSGAGTMVNGGSYNYNAARSRKCVIQ